MCFLIKAHLIQLIICQSVIDDLDTRSIDLQIIGMRPRKVQMLFIIFEVLTNLLIPTIQVAAMTVNHNENECYFPDVSKSVSSVLCAVEMKIWIISPTSKAIQNVGCLLGAEHKCKQKRHIPTSDEVKKSHPPPPAKDEQYQALAMKAETIVPQTWWREAFADENFLLTKNGRDLPRKQFDRLRNNTLKNLLNCVTSQTFIRKSFAFDKKSFLSCEECNTITIPSIESFFKLWNDGHTKISLGGSLNKNHEGFEIWSPTDSDGKLLISALGVLDSFYTNYGETRTGCFELIDSSSCRGAVAGQLICCLIL